MAVSRIVIVDDNEDSADVLRDVLTLAGHDAKVAYDGPQALQVAHEFRPDVILCDIGLPGAMSGYDVASAVRAEPTLRHALLVAITGYSQPEDRAQARRAGFDIHMTKPVDLNAIESAIDAHALQPR